MLWSDRVPRASGAILILLVVCVILFAAFGISIGDNDIFKRDEVGPALADIDDNRSSAILSIAFSIAVDSVLSIVVAAIVYRLLRDRSPLLALVGFAGILVSSAAFFITDFTDIAMVVLADDFAEGGAGTIAAGDPNILEIARAVGITGAVAAVGGTVSLTLGMLAFGAIVSFAPEGAANPPRWIGWPAILAGVVAPFAWLSAAADDFFVLFFIANIAALVWTALLGGWLLISTTDPDVQPSPSPA